MSFNTSVVAAFEEMATLLELTGANGFKVNAHAKVARVVDGLGRDLEPTATAPDAPKTLGEIDGIGASSAKKIVELATTGGIAELETLRSEVPAGLREVMRVPGLGPKTVRRFWTEAGVESLADLEARLADGSLASLPRMGRKTLDNISESIEFMRSSGGRTRLGDAMPLAEAIVAELGGMPGVGRIAYAGSLRRGRDTIGDLDILATTSDPAAISEAFRTMAGVTRVLVAGETKSSVRLDSGIQVDLRVVDEDSWGSALMYFTGSKEHNVVLRERAIAKGLRLNEYGLFPADDLEGPPQDRGIAPVAAESESAIYEALDLAWIPPELREDRGEFERDAPADLIEVEAIVSELHSHTTASDGRLSIDELAEVAMAAGRRVLAITDHSKSSAQAGGLDEDRLRRHVDDIRAANDRIDGITLLAGSEVDILADGRLDYDDEILAMLDVVVASPHVALRQDPAAATARLCAAARHPLVHVLGHPTGRLIPDRKGLEPDMEKLIEAAIEGGTALEINSNPWRLDLRDIHARMAIESGCRLAIDTDAHRGEHLDFIRYGVLTARRAGARVDDCVNCLDEADLLAWLRSRR